MCIFWYSSKAYPHDLEGWSVTSEMYYIIVAACIRLLLVGPIANAADVLQPSRLIVLTLSPPPVWTFPRSPPGTSTSPVTREILVAKGGTMSARINQKFCLKLRPPRQFRDLLHAANLRHGTHGFTSLRKEGVLRIFSPWPGLNPWTLVLKGNTLPLDHWSRSLQVLLRTEWLVDLRRI